MDQEAIIEAIGKHLDTVESYVNAIILLSLAAVWAGIRRSREIEALGTKFDRRHAFWVLAVFYLIANMALLVLFLRIGDLMLLLTQANVTKGITKLMIHSWVLNPFAYFGNSGIAKIHSSEGFGLLVVTWWLCNTSLSTLMDDKRHRVARILLALFLIIGLASMFAIQRVTLVSVRALQTVDLNLYRDATGTFMERQIGAFLGILVGALTFVAANRLQTRWTDNTVKTG